MDACLHLGAFSHACAVGPMYGCTDVVHVIRAVSDMLAARLISLQVLTAAGIPVALAVFLLRKPSSSPHPSTDSTVWLILRCPCVLKQFLCSKISIAQQYSLQPLRWEKSCENAASC